MAFTYTYDISADLPGGVCNSSKLHAEIDASAIATTLVSVNHDVVADTCKVTFVSELSGGDKITLDNNASAPAGGLLAAHDNTFDTPALITSGVLLQQEGDGVNDETLSSNKTLAYDDADMQRLDPGGSNRDVTLQEEAASKGRRVRILNTANAAEDLVVKNDGAGTIATLNQDEAAWFVCDGTTWFHMGIETIAQT